MDWLDALSVSTSPITRMAELPQHVVLCGPQPTYTVLYAHHTSRALFSRFAVPRESERQRIEAQNPNPKMPMVRYMGGTWRVGGLLALSRAFGDSYLKVG